MADISLAKALKIKNRLTGRLAKIQGDIQTFNSVSEGQAGQIDVPDLMKAREALVASLVNLKTAINDANRETQRDIYDLAEKKASVQFLSSLSTLHGRQPALYPSTTDIIYFASFKKCDLDALIVTLEREIDHLQDKLDQFNQSCRIKIDDRILMLVS